MATAPPFSKNNPDIAGTATNMREKICHDVAPSSGWPSLFVLSFMVGKFAWSNLRESIDARDDYEICISKFLDYSEA